MRSKSNVHYYAISQEDVPNNEKWTRWEVVPGAPDRVNIPCLMHI